MSNESDDVKRWTARRKATAVMDFLKGKATPSELARSHDLTVAEVEQWLEVFVSMGTEALRCHPRDAEARDKAEKKELLAKIGEFTMESGAEPTINRERRRPARREAKPSKGGLDDCQRPPGSPI